MTSLRTFPLHWLALMDYVEKNGGYLRADIKFKDGLPILVEEVKKQVRLDLNHKNRINPVDTKLSTG